MVPNTQVLPNRWFNRTLMVSLLGSVSILLIGLLAWQTPFSRQIKLDVGQISPNDIVSPSEIRYESKILTEQARDRAAQAVPEQYDSTEGRVRRQQVSRAREILEFISLVRNDPFATTELKTDYLLAITDLALTPEVALQIQTLSADDWTAVVNESPQALDRVMRDEIRESTLPNTQRRVPSLISADLDEAAGAVTANLVRALIRPNSLLNQNRTAELRANASKVVPVQYNVLQQGETIIRAGDRVSAEDVEALTQVGLLQQKWDWWMLVRAVALTVILLIFVVIALYHLRPTTLYNYQELAVLVVVTVIGLLAAKFMIVANDWLPYLYPLAALGMLITVLVDLRVTFVWTIAFALIVQYLAGNNGVVTVYACMGTLIGALFLGRVERLSAFLWAGLAVAVSNLMVLLAFHTASSEWLTSGSMTKLMQALLMVFLNASLSASIALIGYFILGNLFNITTSLQLTELSRPTHPLLRQLLLKASGTYHHTILVSNLAERAAAAIGADAYLARVGAYYHDIGKTLRPYFFTENIVDGPSPHDKLDPLTSAQIIISHVRDGIDLAQKYHLPERIQDFIREHHGRTVTQYFLTTALRLAEEGEQINEEDFRYPGPSPRSKETAILMLADTCEAAVRAIRPATREELARLVYRLIDERVDQGELNESDLTFKDLQTIKEVFLQVLQGVHHPRITYPEPAKQSEKNAKTDGDAVPSAQPKEPILTKIVGDKGTSSRVAPNAAEPVTPGGIEESINLVSLKPFDQTGHLM
ncbi:HDIG domain-containing protein [soil metagenome]